MRDRLIELLDTAFIKSDDNFGMPNVNQFADYLLENGVVIPVRCKDCKYFTRNNGGYCEGNVGLNMTNENQYCSYGELKEYNNETK